MLNKTYFNGIISNSEFEEDNGEDNQKNKIKQDNTIKVEEKMKKQILRNIKEQLNKLIIYMNLH